MAVPSFRIRPRVGQNLKELKNAAEGRIVPGQAHPEIRRMLEKKKIVPLGSKEAGTIYNRCYFKTKNLPPETRDKVEDGLTDAWKNRDKLSKEDWDRIEKNVDREITEADEERKDPLRRYKSL